MLRGFAARAIFRRTGADPAKRSTSLEALDLTLPSGRLRAHAFGDPGARLTLCLPGLSSTSRTFDRIVEGLGGVDNYVVALDLRGRGFSDVTPPGTYGWLHHAQDVLAAANALGATTFDVIGHSMGAYVALQTAQLAPARIRRMVLIDGLGIPRYSAFRLILRGVERLERPYKTAEEYIEAVRALEIVVPWNDYWDRAFRYDLVVAGDGFRPRTSARAVFEDIAYGAQHDPRPLWRGLEMPILVLRAAIPLSPPDGFILPEFDTERFVRVTAATTAKDIHANHLGIVMHPESVEAIRDFMR